VGLAALAAAPETHSRRVELADVFRSLGESVPVRNREQGRAVRAITSCRTAALGGHVRECDACGHRQISYNSCRNRHCPKCQGLEEVRWREAQERRLLPIDYHHVVFTVPDALHGLFLDQPRLAYRLLFSAVSETLAEVALRPSNLGARIGFTTVLHTWTQTLTYHPHVHCIVTGGGLSPDGTRWVRAKPRFLFAIAILSRVFRGKLLDKLERAIEAKKFRLARAQARAAMRRAARLSWVVYSKPPFAGPKSVLRYLARYTHRIAISNHRLVSLHDGQVSFLWRDRADGDQVKRMTLGALEFTRRFLLHVLPGGFVRIRHYGLLANASFTRTLARCRELLGVAPFEPVENAGNTETWQETLERVTGKDHSLCPACGLGQLLITEEFTASRPAARAPPGSARR
jgi:hypothetical protein